MIVRTQIIQDEGGGDSLLSLSPLGCYTRNNLRITFFNIAFTIKRYNSSGSLADSAFCTDLLTLLKPAQIPVFIIQNKKWEQRHLALV
jgi:hypothetical protein